MDPFGTGTHVVYLLALQYPYRNPLKHPRIYNRGTWTTQHRMHPYTKTSELLNDPYRNRTVDPLKQLKEKKL